LEKDVSSIESAGGYHAMPKINPTESQRIKRILPAPSPPDIGKCCHLALSPVKSVDGGARSAHDRRNPQNIIDEDEPFAYSAGGWLAAGARPIYLV